MLGLNQLESYLWEAMNRMRGFADTRDTMEYLLGLLLLKHLSDRSETADTSGKTLVEDSVRLPKEARWSRIRSSSWPAGELADVIRALESHPESREIGRLLIAVDLPKLTEKPDLCREVIEIVSSIDLGPSTATDLANLNMQLLGSLADATGARSGEFYTPQNLSLLMAELLAPAAGSTIYDPACGTGSLLLAAYRQSMHGVEGEDKPETQLLGQEINPQTAALARMNLLLQGFPQGSIQRSIAVGNTLTTPIFLEGGSVGQFDYVIANPPIGLRLSRSEVALLQSDKYNRFTHFISDVPKVADYAFIQHIVESLSGRGRAVVLVGLRTLFVSGREGRIRRALVENDLVEAVITLSENLLPNTSASTAILILNKAKPENLWNKVLLVYANEEYESGDRKRRVIGEQNRRRIVEVVRNQEEQHRFATVVPLGKIAANDYTLMPASYIDLIGICNFMGGNFRWMEIGKEADVFQGMRFKVRDGVTPVIQGRDLSVDDLTLDDLTLVDVPSDLSDPVYTEAGDILIQRIGQNPKVYLVEQELQGALVKDTVYVIRFHDKAPVITRYLVEFLNSDIGQALLSTGVGGAVVPTMRLTDLRRLRVPIPDKLAVDLVNDIHEVERVLLGRVDRTRSLRQRLFSIEDPDQVNPQLRNLSTEAQVLASSLVQADDLDFQVRNFYPLPLAYPYRLLSAIREPTKLYQEQLRVAENVLVFLGLVGLVFAAHSQALDDPSNVNLTTDSLASCWRGGISPGDWQEWGRQAGVLLRENREFAATNSFASLWFKGSSTKQSDFAEATKRLVELKNDFKHDRGPKEIPEFEQASQEMDRILRQCLKQLSFFVQYPIRLVGHMDRDWETDQAVLDTLVYVGDHPGLRQEQKRLADTLPENKLYLELTDQEWVSLYPLISVQYCPDCKFRETYFIDRWEGPGKRTVLKSFERGHTHDGDDEARMIDRHLQHWLRIHLSATGTN